MLDDDWDVRTDPVGTVKPDAAVKMGAFGIITGKPPTQKQVILAGSDLRASKVAARSKVMRTFPSWPQCCGKDTFIIEIDDFGTNWQTAGTNKRFVLACAVCSDSLWKDYINKNKDAP